MRVYKSDRGFQVVEHDEYAVKPAAPARLLQQSSAIDFDAPRGADHPGSSFLWVGDKHHLNRQEVDQLVMYLQAWLMTGNFVDDSTIGK